MIASGAAEGARDEHAPEIKMSSATLTLAATKTISPSTAAAMKMPA